MSKKFANSIVEVSAPYAGSLDLRASLLPKKDKRKIAISNKLLSMEERFYQDNHRHLQEATNQIQTDLAQIQEESSPVYLEKIQNCQERRDYELTRLVLWENYLISRVDKETREDLAKINEEYANFIKIIKDKLYQKLVKKIKLLKEDKVMKDLANVNHYTIDLDLMEKKPVIEKPAAVGGAAASAAIAASPQKHLTPDDRRSRRTRAVMESSYNTDSNLSGNESSIAGYVSASGKRRRFASARAAASGASIGSHNTRSYSSSAEEASFLSDNNSLSEILFGKTYQGKTYKGGARAKSKPFTGVSGLEVEEVTRDLEVLEGCLEKMGEDVVFSRGKGMQ